MISIFELFSIGIGPSSSHTVGPMRSSYAFIQSIKNRLTDINRIQVSLHGSLAYTGKGHASDNALMMGLNGEQPETIDPDQIANRVSVIQETHQLNLLQTHTINFNPLCDIIFDYKESFDYHPNAMKFTAFDKDNKIISEDVYFSIGGGFIVNQSEITQAKKRPVAKFTFESGNELLQLCKQNNMSISEIMLANELEYCDKKTIYEKLLHIDKTMKACIDKGCNTGGTLPGKLHVQRRAPGFYKKLLLQGKPSALHPQAMNWLNVFAMAVNEENAAGSRIVTAPTNGAAGIIPAVLNYYKYFYPEANDDGIVNFLLTAGAIGILYKKNASISGAEMGCQGEVGVACSMAAAGLAAVLNGTPNQIENAAEIGMEHNLGLTCDPVNGLVQIPCIERNAMGAVKAVNATSLALAENGDQKISLDMVISTMREIGENMNSIYKETSRGGLAVAVNLSEC